MEYGRERGVTYRFCILLFLSICQKKKNPPLNIMGKDIGKEEEWRDISGWKRRRVNEERSNIKTGIGI